MRVLLLPNIEGGVDTELAAEVADRGAGLACRIAYTICSSENFDCFIGPLLSSGTAEAVSLLPFSTVVVLGGDVRYDR